ncbi:MAG: hypothetical protein M1812_000698 [Candelaria pacifica]|nr:MAG: hypothetical protein M1812_000698 [Candelaria pacifica]
MSSMFCSPNDVTSSDPESSGDGEEPQFPDAMKAQASEKVRAEDVEKFESAPTSPTAQTAEPDTDASGHSNFIMSSLLEEHCLNRAAQALSSVREDPEVQALGKSLYAELSKQLSGYGLVEQGYDGDDKAHFRRAYIQGLDQMALNVLQEEISRNIDPSAILISHGPLGAEGPSQPRKPALRRTLTGTKGTSKGSLAIEEIDANAQLQKHALGSMVTKPQPIKGPLSPQPSNGEFIHASRYSHDFAELGFLGKGGYGKVYHVINHLDGREYAIKKITLSQRRLKKLEDGGITELEALLREIRTLAKLEHSNVVRYFGGWLEHMGAKPVISDTKALDSPRKMLSDPPTADENDFDDDPPFGCESSFHNSGEEDDGIIFDFSSELSEKALMDTKSDSKQRRASQATVSSTLSKKSYVNSCDEEHGETDVIQHGQGITIAESSMPNETSEEGLSDVDLVPHPRERSDSIDSVGPTLTLHIQMSLHPLSLSQYLSPDAPKVAEDGNLARRHCYHLEPSLRLMLAILSGVEYLHSQNYVHRDLKPGNILMSVCQGTPHPAGSVVVSPCTDCDSDEGEQVRLTPRIGDFGLVADITQPVARKLEHMAKDSDGAGFVESLPNSPGTVPLPPPPRLRAVGTEFYRPSVISGSPNEKYDVFALGVIAVELLCKFTTKMERHATLSNLHKGILPSTFQSDEKSGRLANCIKKMLCENEIERYGCKQVRECMEGLLAQVALQ